MCERRQRDCLQAKEEFTNSVDCEDSGELKEYVGCKVHYDREQRTVTITQPVLMQSLKDEFELPTATYECPAAPGTTLQSTITAEEVDNDDEQREYRKAVGKLLHIMRWSRPDILNAVREVSRFLGRANEAHVKACKRILKYCVDTSERGLRLQPTGHWDGRDRNYEFKIGGKCDSEYAKNEENRRSVGGHVVYLNDAPVVLSCKAQRTVSLSVTEAE